MEQLPNCMNFLLKIMGENMENIEIFLFDPCLTISIVLILFSLSTHGPCTYVFKIPFP